LKCGLGVSVSSPKGYPTDNLIVARPVPMCKGYVFYELQWHYPAPDQEKGRVL
jgi:hypothetical protein